jgi:hypothetical protein
MRRLDIDGSKRNLILMRVKEKKMNREQGKADYANKLFINVIFQPTQHAADSNT